MSPAFNEIHAGMVAVAPERNKFIERKYDEVPEPPTPTVPLEVKAPDISTASESAHEAVAKAPSKRNPPSEKAIQCHRLKILKGDTLTQSAIARQVYNDPKKQSQVCRDIRRVTRWLQDGNVLPGLEMSRPKIHSIDPRKLDKGPRADRGRVRDA